MNRLEAHLRDWRRDMDEVWGTERAEGPLGAIVFDYILWFGVSVTSAVLFLLLLFFLVCAIWEGNLK